MPDLEVEVNQDAIPTDNGAGQTSEKSQVVVKSFSEMTDEEKLALPDDELLRHLEGTEPEKVEEEDAVEEEPASEEKSIEQKLKDGESLSHEELEKATPEQRGRYYSFAKLREKNRELEALLEKEKAVKEGQLEIIKHFKESQAREGDKQFKTEYERVSAEIRQRATEYQEEFGEPYRPTFDELQALEIAKQNDSVRAQQSEAARREQEQRESAVKTFQQKIDDGVKAMEASGIKDFGTVYKDLIEPLINPDAGVIDRDIATANAQVLINLALKGKNPAEYAYKFIAPQHPNAEKYFKEKKQININKSLADEASKKTTKTSSHVQAKATDGKTLVNMRKVLDNFEHWDKRLTPEQFEKVAMGEDVYI